jgi:uncharacterized cupredoxin-like copper-binding protein
MKTKKFNTFCTSIVIAGIVGTASAWAGGTHGGSEAPNFSFGSPGSNHEVARAVQVEAGNMEFHIEALDIKEGETIRFVVNNVDEIDHDFTIGPPAKMHNDPNAVYLKPGETKELVWKFKNVAKLEYACNIPGHYESGMMGRFQAAS